MYHNSTVTNNERRNFAELAGELMWLVDTTLPQASFVASIMRQKTALLVVENIIYINSILRALKNMNAFICYRKPNNLTVVEVTTFSDASFNTSKCAGYGQTGLLTGLRFHDNTFHPISWASFKQKRVCYSAYGAEILACTNANDRGFYVKHAVQHLLAQIPELHVFLADSKGLFDNITALHEGRDYHLRPTGQHIRDPFDSQELDTLRWILRQTNIADALTEYNAVALWLLNQVMAAVFLIFPEHLSMELESWSWTYSSSTDVTWTGGI